MRVKRVVLVRHGETMWHKENRYAGRSDVELTPRGEAQALTLARWAGTAGLDAVWSSQLSRARRTAQPAAAAAGLRVKIDERLAELDFGRGEGKTSAEMKAEFPVARAAFEADPAQHFLPGGEDPEDAAHRGLLALADIAASLPEQGRALVVAHNTLIRLLLCRLLGVPLSRYRTLFPKLSNGTGTELGFQGSRISLLTFNAALTIAEKEPTSHV
jgi:probable phosphoglycerate mutase